MLWPLWMLGGMFVREVLGGSFLWFYVTLVAFAVLLGWVGRRYKENRVTRALRAVGTGAFVGSALMGYASFLLVTLRSGPMPLGATFVMGVWSLFVLCCALMDVFLYVLSFFEEIPDSEPTSVEEYPQYIPW